jgi:hypothetical protein
MEHPMETKSKGLAEFEAWLGTQKPKPKRRWPVLVWDGKRVVADIDVIVSEKDPNSFMNRDYDVVRRVRCQK